MHAEATPQKKGLFGDIADAIRGVPRDYTKGSVPRAILLLAVPMVLEMSMQSLFALVDVFFVGKLGYDAVAIVGVTDSLLALIFAVAIGLSMGTAAMVARRIGEKNVEGARTAAVQAIVLGVLISIPTAIFGAIYAEELLVLVGASTRVAAAGKIFPIIMLGGNATITLLFLINAIFRGAGDPAMAMRALWIANISNMILDPILIFGWGPIPAMGLMGAAVATTGGRALGIGYQLYKLTRQSSRIFITPADLRIVPAVMSRLARVSGIGIVQYLISTASYVGLTRIIAIFGDSAIAGYTIAVRVIIFILMPAWGMGNAAATLVGQNLGAGNPDRAERSTWLTARANAVFLGIVSVTLLLFGDRISSYFSDDPAVQAIATSCLAIVSYSYVFWGFGAVTVMAFNGAGDTTTPTWINFISFWVVQIPLAYYLSVGRQLGPDGAFLSITVAQLVLATLGVVLFRRGSWRTQSI